MTLLGLARLKIARSSHLPSSLTQKHWLLCNSSVQPGKHHPAPAGDAEQPGEQEEQECHRVREHRADPAAHHAGEERRQQGGLVRGRGLCTGGEGLGVSEGLPEGGV